MPYRMKKRVGKASDFNFKRTKSDLVLDMCLKLKAKKYIFGSQGKNYCDQESFKKIQLRYTFKIIIILNMIKKHSNLLKICQLLTYYLMKDLTVIKFDANNENYIHKNYWDNLQASSHKSIWPWNDVIKLIKKL